MTIREGIEAVKQKWHTLMCLPLVILIHNTAHNAVFYRWNRLQMYAVKTLPDILIDLVPLSHEDSGRLISKSDAIRLFSFLLILLLFSYTVVWVGQGRKTVLSLNRFIVVYSAASVLRCFTFFATVLPGTASYCLDPSLGGSYTSDRAPKSVSEIFTRFDWTHSCGDLLFSGHVILTMCFFMTIQTISPSALIRNAIKLPFAAFLVCTPLSRKHYTIDVLVAVYVVFFIWKWFHVILEKEEEKTKRRRTKREQILDAIERLA